MWAMIFPIKANSALPQYLIYPSTYRPHSQFQLAGCRVWLMQTEANSTPHHTQAARMKSTWFNGCDPITQLNLHSSIPQMPPPLSRNLQSSEWWCHQGFFILLLPWSSHSTHVPKPTVHKLHHLQISSWPNVFACQPKSVLWHHLTVQIDLFQCF